MTSRAAAVLALTALSACATVPAPTVWSDPDAPSDPPRRGRVVRVHEVSRPRANGVAAGLLGGAATGGLTTTALDERWNHPTRPNAGVAVVGAAGGALLGADAGETGGPARWYEVYVRFDDGGYEGFSFGGWMPFRPGDEVTTGPRGLVPAP